MEQQKHAQQMQQERIREIELARPKYRISILTTGWGRPPGPDQLIFRWANAYTAENYAVIGFVNRVTPDRTDYYLGEMPKSVPQVGNYILIYERKS